MDGAASADMPDEPDEWTGDGGVDPDVEHEAWRQLLFWVGLAELVVCVAVVVVAGALIPPVVVFGVVFLVGLVLLVRPGRVGPVTIGVASILFVFGNLPVVADDLAHPDSFATFFPAAIGLLAGVVGAVALAGFLRRWPVRAIGRVGAAASALALVALGIGLYATLTVEDDVPQEGDLALATDGVEWVPDTLTARAAGDVAVFITNGDPYRHTFAVDDLDVEVELPADTQRRATFTAEAGEYEFHCTVPGHEDMTGTLTVPS
jgi:plastocyanin